jgi:hypothetical protein
VSPTSLPLHRDRPKGQVVDNLGDIAGTARPASGNGNREKIIVLLNIYAIKYFNLSPLAPHG